MAILTVGASGADFTTIQAAVAAAAAGDTIQVANGTYTLSTTLNIGLAGLTITGESRDGVIINYSGTRGTETRTIQINATDVTISNLTLDGWVADTVTGTAGRGYLVWINDASGDGATLDGIKFVNDDLRVSINTRTADNVTITDSLFEGTLYRYAIRGAGENMEITNNEFNLSFYEGGVIQMEYGAPTSGVISGNTFNFGAGVDVLSADASGQFKSDGSAMYTIANWQPHQITGDGLLITDNEFNFLNSGESNAVTGARPQPVAILMDPLIPATGPITITGNEFEGYGFQPVVELADIVDAGDAARGNALDLDGAFQYATFEMPDSIGDEGTISVWVKLDADATGKRNTIIEGPDNGGMELQYRSNSGGQFYGSPNPAQNTAIQSGGAAATAVAWTSIQFTWEKNVGSGGIAHLYVNGAEVSYLNNFDSSMEVWNSVIETLNGTFFVGADPGDASRIFKGMLDDLAIFNEALDQTALDAVRTNAVPVDTANYASLVAHWSFEETTIQDILDGSGGTNFVLELQSLLNADPKVIALDGGTGTVDVQNNTFITPAGTIEASLTGSSNDDTLTGTDGNDTIDGNGGDDVIDGGAGSDAVIITIQIADTNPTVTLGAGSDTIELLGTNDVGILTSSLLTITDFATGPGGDALDISDFLENHLTGWDGTSNPFAAAQGFFNLLQDGLDTYLQVDLDGAGDAFINIVLFQNTTATDFVAGNFDTTYAPSNASPIAEDDTFTAGEDDLAAIIGNALANDTDANASDTLTGVAQSNVAGSNGGLFSIAANGNVTFDPGQDFQSLNTGETAATSFTYTVEDGNGGSDTATVTVTVEGADGAIVIVRSEDTRVAGTGTLTRYFGDSESGVENGRIFSFTYADGILAARELVYEDGRTVSNTFDANGKVASQTITDGPGDTLSYQSSTVTFIDGVRSQTSVLLDNGVTTQTSYAPNGTTRTQTAVIDSPDDGGIYNFQSQTTTYYASGAAASRVTVFDEGERYASTQFSYEENGDPEGQLFIFPDGSSRENIFVEGALDRIVDTDAGGLKTYFGLGGDDILIGSSANDRLFGGDDNDTLNGGEGDDLLVGQAGDDVFVFSGIVGNDTINDFDDAGNDFLDLLAFGISSRDDLDLAGAIAQSGTAVVIDLAAIDEAYEGTITLAKTTLASIGNDDFATIV